ncbi:hypothetical protein B0H14DRAFT_3456909 [Mycena olivaceomarginata]|nr:hypothetical protein B0H14DRAFT_3456909 [Mycena olivaceomarginata]
MSELIPSENASVVVGPPPRTLPPLRPSLPPPPPATTSSSTKSKTAGSKKAEPHATYTTPPNLYLAVYALDMGGSTAEFSEWWKALEPEKPPSALFQAYDKYSEELKKASAPQPSLKDICKHINTVMGTSAAVISVSVPFLFCFPFTIHHLIHTGTDAPRSNFSTGTLSLVHPSFGLIATMSKSLSLKNWLKEGLPMPMHVHIGCWMAVVDGGEGDEGNLCVMPSRTLLLEFLPAMERMNVEQVFDEAGILCVTPAVCAIAQLILFLASHLILIVAVNALTGGAHVQC